MPKLPKPKWLNLSETLAFLNDLGIRQEQAKKALLRAICEGEIGTAGRKMVYIDYKKSWEDDKQSLGALDWDRAEVDWDKSEFQSQSENPFDPVRVYDVEVCRRDIEAWLGDDAVSMPDSTEQDDAKTLERRGRRPWRGWDGFFREMGIRVYCEGIPEKQATLEKHMLQWCQETYDHEPGLSTVREKVSAYLRDLRTRSGQN